MTVTTTRTDPTATPGATRQSGGHPWFDLSGKVAVVTGGSTGIGRGIALAFAEAGASVAVVARRPEPVESTRRELANLGAAAAGIAADVQVPGDVDRLVAEVVDRFGRVDILVNNAGGSFGQEFRRAPLVDLTERDFVGCFAENVLSAFLVSKAVAPLMLAQGAGTIINVSSWAGCEAGPPSAGMGFYPVSKAAFNGLNTVMAAEWAPTIRVNAITPGTIDTPRVRAIRESVDPDRLLASIALGRIGLPEDVAGAAVFLASDAASWVTGITLDVTGGRVAPGTDPVDPQLSITAPSIGAGDAAHATGYVNT
jgi:NAD(P)-dependent dehydrogenase (short-subunit alcohol dehydrogenase family)